MPILRHILSDVTADVPVNEERLTLSTIAIEHFHCIILLGNQPTQWCTGSIDCNTKLYTSNHRIAKQCHVMNSSISSKPVCMVVAAMALNITIFKMYLKSLFMHFIIM